MTICPCCGNRHWQPAMFGRNRWSCVRCGYRLPRRRTGPSLWDRTLDRVFHLVGKVAR